MQYRLNGQWRIRTSTFKNVARMQKCRTLQANFNKMCIRDRHSIDRLKIAQRLNEARPANMQPLQVCIQVNISHEESKSGVLPDELSALATDVYKRQALAEMNELQAAGCVGFSQANIAITDTQVLWRAMEYAATFGFTLFLHAEEPFLAANGVAHDGEVATRLGLKGIPSAAEALALASILRIAQETGAKVHISRLSTAEGVAMIRAAKAQGLTITCDVSANHLHLTEHDIAYFNTNCHLKPPLRSQRDKAALSLGLKDGTIDAICSDHTPVDDDAKLATFAEAEIGATGLELLLPLTLKWAQQEKIALSAAISLISQASANILGIPAGDLRVNSDADICIFDAEEYWKINAHTLKSQGKNTPFTGLELAGKVKTCLLYTSRCV